MIFVLISRRRQPQNCRLNSATILLLPLQKMLLRSQDFTISQDRQRTANLLLSLHALASSWSKKTAFGRSLIISPRSGRNRLNKHVGKGKRRPFRITFAGIARIGGCRDTQHPILVIGRTGDSPARRIATLTMARA